MYLVYIYYIYIYYIPNMSRKNKLVKTHFTKINKKLDKEHTDILKAIDKLYLLCEKHWNTEDKLFKDGLKKMPLSHSKVNSDIKKHISHHNKLLNKVAQLKKDVIEHIEKEDVEHFHWA